MIRSLFTIKLFFMLRERDNTKFVYYKVIVYVERGGGGEREREKGDIPCLFVDFAVEE